MEVYPRENQSNISMLLGCVLHLPPPPKMLQVRVIAVYQNQTVISKLIVLLGDRTELEHDFLVLKKAVGLR